MKIYRARYGGVCFGVKRAIEIALKATKKGKSVYSLGPLIHNRFVVEELRKKGVITVDRIKNIKNQKVIIRSHGIPPALLRKLEREKFEIIDATCPRVRRAQRYVEKLIKEGYFVVIIGEKDHPEVKGLLGYAGNKAVIYSEKLTPKRKKIGVVPQTTLDLVHLTEAIADLMGNVLEMKIYNTICKATILRTREAQRIAEKADLMLIVGGKNSANTTRLYQMCKKAKPSYHIESVDEISTDWFKGVKSVGVTAGASTPKDQVEQVISFLRERFPS
jgi:(E)-4-hydroxy-3-methyl-but-2-enyl pyrophosphate reductase